MSNIDLDKTVDYKREYSRDIKKAKITGDRLTGLCPFHQDKNASFSADLKTGKFTCFSCDAHGNYIDFVARLSGIDTKDAYKKILHEYGIEQEQKALPEDVPYDVDIYASEKHMPSDWLTKQFVLSSGRDKKDDMPYVKIPYFDRESNRTCFRKRYSKASGLRFKWSQGSAGKLSLYGLWSLSKFEEMDYVIMIEGESDTQSLWYMSFPALGVPGASVFKPAWTRDLSQISKIYLHVEPDNGGQVFKNKVVKSLAEGGYNGQLFEFTCAGAGVKDPSALLIEQGKDKATEFIKLQLSGAKKLSVTDVPENIKDAPVNLREPDGWLFNDKGIFQIDQKVFEPKCICRTPIILTRRLRSALGEEKIEVAFKRDGRWQSSSFPRSMIFQSRSIIALADKGCTVTSENSKYIVRFLQALEEENMDIIEVVESTSTFGWQTGGRFLPGHGGDLVMDIDPSCAGWANAYSPNGTLQGWIVQMKDLRENDRFRFIMAGSFAAPLLEILRQRIFFIYNWGGSKGGKTAAIKAALSAWGDPDGLLTNFNSTQVGLERAAAFFSDLPLGIDERQLAGQKQESLEKLVYMLSSGQGKLRGAKQGGIQAMNTWRSVILASGEEPILHENSQTGVGTRMIEIIGAPFDSEDAARKMHLAASQNCGWAGPKFIEYIQKMDRDKIVDLYNVIMDSVQDLTRSKNGAHVSAISAVAVADILLEAAVFNQGSDMKENIKRSLQMAENINREIVENEPPDVNISAVKFILDWISMNGLAFSDKSYKEPRLGFIDPYDHVCVFPTALRTALEKEGFSNRKTIKYMADNDLIETLKKTDKHSATNTVTKRFEGQVVRVISLRTDLMQEHIGTEPEEALSFEPVVGNEPFQL